MSAEGNGVVEKRTFAKERTTRKPRGEGFPTYRELLSTMDKQTHQIIDAIGRVDLMHATVQRVETALKGIQTTLGEEKEDGAGNMLGTGLVGRVRRNENSVAKLLGTYRLWIAFGAGFVVCIGTFTAVIWWLIGDKIGMVLK